MAVVKLRLKNKKKRDPNKISLSITDFNSNNLQFNIFHSIKPKPSGSSFNQKDKTKYPDNTSSNRIPNQSNFRPTSNRKQDNSYSSKPTVAVSIPATRSQVKNQQQNNNIPAKYLSSAGKNIVNNQKAALPRELAPQVSNPFTSNTSINRYNLRQPSKSTNNTTYSKPNNSSSKRGPFA